MDLGNLAMPFVLRRGHSANPADGACAMDAVNWLAHGKHGDRPACACPVIGAYVIIINDRLADAARQRLLPFLHRIAGSRAPDAVPARLHALAVHALACVLPFAYAASGLDRAAATVAALVTAGPGIDRQIRWAVRRGLAEASAHNLDAESRAVVVAQRVNGAEMARRQVMHHWPRYQAESELREPMVAADCALSFAAAASAAGNPDVMLIGLDMMLKAGPEGEPWSADAIDHGFAAFEAGGAAYVRANEQRNAKAKAKRAERRARLEAARDARRLILAGAPGGAP